MSKTWVLPPRSSQATEGDGHRNKQSRNSVVCVQVFAQSATGEQRRENTSCPGKAWAPRAHRHSTPELHVVTQRCKGSGTSRAW